MELGTNFLDYMELTGDWRVGISGGLYFYLARYRLNLTDIGTTYLSVDWST